MKELLKIGHRGAKAHWPENTFPSFNYAFGWYADAIEFDVRATHDGALIVFHDPTLDRLVPGCSGMKVCDLTLRGIQQFRIGNERIPTLREVCEEFGVKKRMTLNIELKESGLQEKVLDTVRHFGLLDSVIVSAFARDENGPGDSSTWQDLFWLQVCEPRIRIALLAETPALAEAAILVARQSGDGMRDHPFPIHALNFSRELVDEAMVRRVHEETHAKIMVWTVNGEDEIRRFRKMGVDGIFSDSPEMLL